MNKFLQIHSSASRNSCPIVYKLKSQSQGCHACPAVMLYSAQLSWLLSAVGVHLPSGTISLHRHTAGGTHYLHLNCTSWNAAFCDL